LALGTLVDALRARSRGFGIGGLGGAALALWWLAAIILAAPFPRLSEAARMAPPFFLVGFAIALLGEKRPPLTRRVAVRVLAGIVLAIGVGSLLAPWVRAASVSPRPSLALADLQLDALRGPSFVVLAGAILARDAGVGLVPRRFADALALTPAIGAMVVLVACLYELPHAVLVDAPRVALLHTSVGLLLASAAILSTRPPTGLTRALTSEGAQGRFLRRTIAAGALVPIAFGAVRIGLERSSYWDPRLGPPLHAIATGLAFAALVVVEARALFRSAETDTAALERLRESEDDLRMTIDGIGDGVIATDAAGRIVRMSARAAATLGCRSEDAVGKHLETLFVVVDRATRIPMESLFDHVARNGDAADLVGHAVLVGTDGTERAVLRSGAPILGRLGILRGVVLVLEKPVSAR
jgi:PAS domain S-box-containing protein